MTLPYSSQSLEEDLKKVLKGHLEDVAVALLKTPAQFDAEELRASMKVSQKSSERNFTKEKYINIRFFK